MMVTSSVIVYVVGSYLVDGRYSVALDVTVAVSYLVLL